MSQVPTIDGMRVVPTRHSTAELVKRLQVLAKSKGLTEFAKIDFGADAARSGLTLPPTILLILGNPKSGTPLIVASPSLAIDLPLKVLIWSDASGSSYAGYNEPEYLERRHGFPPALLGNITGLGALVAKAAGTDELNEP